MNLTASLTWDSLRLVNDVVELLVILQRLHLAPRSLRARVVVLELLGLVLVRGVNRCVCIVIRVLLILLLKLRLLSVPPDLVEDPKVFQKVILVPVESEDFEYANHLVVSILDKHVEERHCGVLDHPQHRVLSQDLVLVLHDAVNVIVTLGILLLRVVWLVEKLLLLIVLIVQILRLSWGRLLIAAGE